MMPSKISSDVSDNLSEKKIHRIFLQAFLRKKVVCTFAHLPSSSLNDQYIDLFIFPRSNCYWHIVVVFPSDVALGSFSDLFVCFVDFARRDDGSSSYGEWDTARSSAFLPNDIRLNSLLFCTFSQCFLCLSQVKYLLTDTGSWEQICSRDVGENGDELCLFCLVTSSLHVIISSYCFRTPCRWCLPKLSSLNRRIAGKKQPTEEICWFLSFVWLKLWIRVVCQQPWQHN